MIFNNKNKSTQYVCYNCCLLPVLKKLDHLSVWYQKAVMALGVGRIVHRERQFYFCFMGAFFVFLFLTPLTSIINKLIFPSSFGCLAKDTVECLS